MFSAIVFCYIGLAVTKFKAVAGLPTMVHINDSYSVSKLKDSIVDLKTQKLMWIRDFIDYPWNKDYVSTLRTEGRTSMLHFVGRSKRHRFTNVDTICLSICSFCEEVLRKRWSALCLAECKLGGLAYEACVSVWTSLGTL